LSVRDLMSQLQSLDVKVWVEGDRLRVSAPEGALDASLKDEMHRRKPEIISFLDVAARATAFPASIVPLQPGGSRTPIFAVPGHNGDVFCYVRLASELGPDQPFYALQPQGLDGRRAPRTSIGELAADFTEDITAFRPDGPLVVAGFCLGGATAFETGCRLRASGRDVSMLALFGSPCPTALKPANLLRTRASFYASRVVHHTRSLVTLPRGERLAYLRGRARAAVGSDSPLPSDTTARHRVILENVTIEAVKAYDPGTYEGRITLYFPDATWRGSEDRPEDWKKFASEGVEERIGPDGCNGDLMLREYAPDFARLFAADLGSCAYGLQHGSSVRSSMTPACGAGG
jgi:thioesterase domain-containing protein